MFGLTFKVVGLINSFKQIDFKTYHRTYLCPTKWNILGFLTNVCWESERFYYELSNEEELYVQIKILKIWWFIKDLWHIKDLKHKDGSIIRREKLFNSIYEIEIIWKRDLIDKFYNGIKFPKRTPSLGMDDEIVNILHIDVKNFERKKLKKMDKILFLDYPIRIVNFFPYDWIFFHYPQVRIINKYWNVKWRQANLLDKKRRSKRRSESNLYFVDFYGWIVEFDKEIDVWM